MAPEQSLPSVFWCENKNKTERIKRYMNICHTLNQDVNSYTFIKASVGGSVSYQRMESTLWKKTTKLKRRKRLKNTTRFLRSSTKRQGRAMRVRELKRGRGARKGHPQNYLALYERLARGCGVWPAPGRSLPPAAAVIVPAHIAFFLLSVAELSHNWGNLQPLTETAQNFCVYMVTFHKWLVMFWRAGDYRSLMARLDSNFGQPEQRTDPEFSGIILRCVSELRVLTVVWTFMVFTTLSGFIVSPLMGHIFAHTHPEGNNATDTTPALAAVPSFPYRNWTPFDESPQPYYAFLYVYHSLMGVSLIYMIPLYDLLFFAFVHHATAQFSVLQRALRGLRERAEKVLRAQQTPPRAQHDLALEKQMRAQIASCAKHHNDLYRFIDDVESIVNPVFLNQFLGSSVLFCMTAFQMTTNHNMDTLEMLIMAALLLSAMFELGIFCFFANRVMDNSRLVGYAAYSSEWFLAPQPIRRSVSIVIARSVRPVRLTFGKFAVLSLETFASILQISYTYFTVLNRINE